MDRNIYIFQDKQGHRWLLFKVFAFIGVLAIFASGLVFVRSLLIEPKLSPLYRLDEVARQLHSFISKERAVHVPVSPPGWLLEQKNQEKSLIRQKSRELSDVRLGFYVQWDPESYRSLILHKDELTHVVPEMFTIGGVPPKLHMDLDRRLIGVIAESKCKLLPTLTNLVNDIWQAESVESLIRYPQTKQEQFFRGLISSLQRVREMGVGVAGILIDWEGIDPFYAPKVTQTLALLSGMLHKADLELWLSVPMGNDLKAFSLAELSSYVDQFVAMLYDETGESDSPGPIASLNWVKEWLKAVLNFGESKQWVIGIGSYGYDWQAGRRAETVSFQQAMMRANFAAAPPITYSFPYDGLTFQYQDRGLGHTLWFLDAVSFHNQMEIVGSERARGFALWRLGTEDPGVWQVMKRFPEQKLTKLQKLAGDRVISQIGRGDFLTLSNNRQDGLRRVKAEGDGLWSEIYESYPSYALIYQQGEEIENNKVALTFDDGPDPAWTPQLLDILRDAGASATFFVTGSKANENRSIVRRIVEEGHLLGNHTYSHANISLISEARAEIELNATQTIVQGLTGMSTILFRPPYNADRMPHNTKEFQSLFLAQNFGYLPVSASIDLEDWRALDKEVLLNRLKQRRKEGNVVLLHDAGGDRSVTVLALPAIINYLRDRGDGIVPLNELLDVPREKFMPAAQKEKVHNFSGMPAQSIAMLGFQFLFVGEEFLWAFMILSSGLVFLRTVIILILAIRHKQQELSDGEPVRECPAVSVVMAAFNEERVISSTILSVLKTDYVGPLELVVVDDGSTDRSLQIISSLALVDSRLKVISQPNAGKAAALSKAVAASKHDILIMLDADTQFEPGTIQNLVSFLLRDGVGAVSGRAMVGNSGGWIGLFQSLEYACGFNLDRRAYDVWNCVTVVPGAVSAFRRQAIVAAGGISNDTLAEDTDLTLSIHRSNWRVRYASQARAWTEAPESVGSLLRQRKRWAFGTLQCLWKHRDLLFDPSRPALGFFSLPAVWFCHILLVALIPLVDFLLVVSLLSGQGAILFEYAAVFLLVDLFLAASACIIEREALSKALLIVPMRFLYRPLLGLAVWSSLFRAVRGTWVGWGKQERRGTVQKVFELTEASGDIHRVKAVG